MIVRAKPANLSTTGPASSLNTKPTVARRPGMSACLVEPANALAFALFTPLHRHPAFSPLPYHPHHHQPVSFLFTLIPQ